MLFLFLVAACNSDGDDDSTGSAADACDGAAIVAWDNFGQGFLRENCASCHAATVKGDARNDAPPDVTFDTKEQVWAWALAILSMATGDDPLMPPDGGPSDDDRTRLYWWLACGEEGT